MFTKIQRNKNVWDQKNKNQPDKLGIKRGNNISWKRKKQRAQWYIEIQKKMEEWQMQYVCVRVFHLSFFFVFKHTCKHIQ